MAFTQGHALLIGVGSHKYAPALNVPITVDDAQALRDILVDGTKCGYPENQVVFLKNEQATKENILLRLSDLAKTAGEDDTVVIFFCGHGMLGTDSRYYLAGHDARLDRSVGRITAYTGVSEGELIRQLREIRANRVLMIFNACQSGHISPVLGASQPAFQESSMGEDTSSALLATGEGRIIITACREDQYSWIGKGGDHTIFTQALLDGLSGRGVINSNGYIGAYSLYEYIYETVCERVREEEQETQEPELNVIKGIGPFPVALFRGATSLGTFEFDQPVPELPGVRTVKPEKALRAMNNLISTGDIEAESGSTVNIAGGDINTTNISGGITVKNGDFVFGNQINRKPRSKN